MRFGIGLIPQNDYNKTIDFIKIAENTGFQYAWIYDNFKNNYYKLLRNIAFETETIKVCSGVTNPYIRDADELSHEMLSLDDIYPERVIIGLGVGSKEKLKKYDIDWTNPINTLKSAVNSMKKITNKKIPIYIEAQSQSLLNYCQKNTDGVLIPSSNPKDFKYLKSESDFDIVSYSSTSINTDSEVAKTASQIAVAFMVAGVTPHIIKRYDVSEKIANEIYINLCKGDIGNATRLVNDELINKFSLTGTPDEIINKINDLKEVGVDQIIVTSPIGKNIKESIILFSEIIESF